MHMLQLMSANAVVNWFVCACCCRGGMIQTNEQYEFVHQTLVLFEAELADERSTAAD